MPWMPRTSEKVTTQLARLECQRRGWDLQETTWTERFPRGGGKFAVVKRDLFGIADGVVLLWKPLENGVHTIALQWTDTTSVSNHLTKISRNPLSRALRRAQWSIIVWGFDTTSGALKREEVAGPLAF